MPFSSRDFQLALSKLIASPQLCFEVINDEAAFFSNYDLSEKDKRRLHTVLRQKGMSACCSLYRMNRITPIFTQLANTSAILGDDLIGICEEFWRFFADATLQYKEEVLEFGSFLMDKIDSGQLHYPYLKEVLQFEIAINELSYIPEGEYRVLKFEHDITELLHAISGGNLSTAKLETSPGLYKVYMRNLELQMEPY